MAKNSIKLKITNELIELPYKNKFYSLLFTPLKRHLIGVRKANLEYFKGEVNNNGDTSDILHKLLSNEMLSKISLSQMNSFNNFKENISYISLHSETILDDYLYDFKIYVDNEDLKNILYEFIIKKYTSYSRLILSFKKELLFHELLLKNWKPHDESYINGVYSSLHAPFINKFFKTFDDTELIRCICNYYFESVDEVYENGGDFIAHCDRVSRKILKLSHKYNESSKIMPFDWFVELDDIF